MNNQQRTFCEKCKRYISNASFNRHACVSEVEATTIRRLYNEGVSLKQIKQTYTHSQVRFALKRQHHSLSEAAKLMHRQYKESFKKSEATKQKLRQAHLKLAKFKRVQSKFKQSDIDRIYELYKNGMSTKELKKVNESSLVNFALKGRRRSYSETTKLAYLQHPERFKVSDATKSRISISMIKAHQEGRANSWKITESYPEKFFNEFLKNVGFKINEDYFREYRFSKYRVDFIFPKMNLIIEIDGSQHYRYDSLQNTDKQKDDYLKSLGYDIMRIPWKVLHYDSKKILDNIFNILKGKNKNVKTFNDEQFNAFNLLVKKKIVKKLLIVLKKVMYKKQNFVLNANRINDILQTNFDKTGAIRDLSCKWSVSHTQVRRFIRLNKDKLIGLKTIPAAIIFADKY